MNAADRLRQAPERIAVLRRTTQDEGGAWSTRRVQNLYAGLYGPGDWRATAQADLRILAALGLLRARPDLSTDRLYTLT